MSQDDLPASGDEEPEDPTVEVPEVESWFLGTVKERFGTGGPTNVS